LCHFGSSHSLTRAEKAAKSNHSRTSERFSRKSNHSRTYAKHRGWGVADPSKTMIFSIDPLRLASPGDFNRLENSARNCELSTEHPTRMLILNEPGESKDHSSSDSATVNCKRSLLSPLFTSTSIAIVGAPTFLGLAPPLSFFRILLNLKLTTGHPVKDAHPERVRRGGRVEGSRRFFPLFLNLKLTTDNLILPKPGNLNRAEDWCHDAGAPGVRSPAWIIAENLESIRSTAGAQCPKN